MDLKLRQYELGKAFCDGVVADAGGPRRCSWSGGRPTTCPALDELELAAALARPAWPPVTA